MNAEERLQSILADTQRAGVYHLPQIDKEPLLRAAEANGFVSFRIDLSRARNKDEMLAAIGKAMDFPDWFGHNFDALTDCLLDMGWRPAEGYLVLLEHCDGIHGNAESDFVTLLQVFQQAAEEWRESVPPVPLWCFVEMQADGIAWLPGM